MTTATAKRRTAKSVNSRFTESTFGSSAMKIDREAGVIRDVKILGRASKNGREYSSEALDQAVTLYEGAKVNVDHPARNRPGEPPQDRGVLERFGVLRNVRREGDGVFGDLHYLKSSKSAEQILEMAEKFPETFGLSHNAEGKTTTRNGRVIVETLHRVHSVDVVDDPATTAGLFESTNQETEMTATTIGKILESAAKDKVAKATPHYKVLRELADAKSADGKAILLEMEGADVPVAVADAPVEVAPTASPEEQVKQALLGAIKAKIDSADEATLLAVLEALGMEDSLTAALKGGKSAGDSGGDEPTKESVNKEGNQGSMQKELTELREAYTRLDNQLKDRDLTDQCKALLESFNRDVTDSRMKLLKQLATDKDRRELIESWPGKVDASKPGRPSFSPPARTEQVTESYTPKNGKELAELLR